MDTFGEKLRKARLLKRLTIRDVEKMIGHSNAYITMLENDKIKKPSASIIYKLAVLYTVDMNELLGDELGVVSLSADCNNDHSNKKLIDKIMLITGTLGEEKKKEILKYAKYIEFRDRVKRD